MGDYTNISAFSFAQIAKQKLNIVFTTFKK